MLSTLQRVLRELADRVTRLEGDGAQIVVGLQRAGGRGARQHRTRGVVAAVAAMAGEALIARLNVLVPPTGELRVADDVYAVRSI